MELISKFKKSNKTLLMFVVAILIIVAVAAVYFTNHVKITVNDKSRMVKKSDIADENVITSEIGINDINITTVKYSENFTVDKDNKYIEFMNIDSVNFVRYIVYDSNTKEQIVDTGIIDNNTKYEWNVYKDLDNGKHNTIWKTEVYESKDTKESIFNLESAISINIEK